MGIFGKLTKNFKKVHVEEVEYDYDEYDDECDEYLSVYDAALIWRSNGEDEDYTFGYSEEELRDAL